MYEQSIISLQRPGYDASIAIYTRQETMYMYITICEILLRFLSLDPSLTKQNIIRIFQALAGQWREIGNETIVPDARANLFNGTPDQVTELAANYYICYHEDPSWKKLSIYLYREGKTEALLLARPYVQTVRGMLV